MTAGRPGDTPVALVQMAFWPGQQVIVGTLATITEQVRRFRAEAPATLVIGEVVRLHEKLKQVAPDTAPEWHPALTAICESGHLQCEAAAWNRSDRSMEKATREIAPTEVV